jgi:hypothetical protein
MSRVHAWAMAVVVAIAAFVAGRLLSGAPDPDLPEPVVVRDPGTSGPDLTGPWSAPATPEHAPSASWEPSIVPPPTVGPTNPSGDDDTRGGDDPDDVPDDEGGGVAGGGDDG